MALFCQRVIVFLVFLFSAILISTLFDIPEYLATFAPICIFCPWLRFLFEFKLIGGSETSTVLTTTVYLLFLFISGSIAERKSKLYLYFILLIFHAVGVWFAIVPIDKGESEREFILWIYSISASLSICYYYIDFLMLRNKPDE